MEIARWDELQLVQRCKDGSEAAFAELVRRHRPRLFTLVYRLISDRETAEDVVQETFVAAFRALGRFEPRPSLSAWLNTIAIRNAGRAAAKSAARTAASLDAMIGDEGVSTGLVPSAARGSDDPHEAAEAAELRREVQRAIAELPFKYRAAVVARYVLDLDYAEAAASLEMGLNTYKSHLLRGTRMLRDALVTRGGRGAQEPMPAILGAPVAVVAGPDELRASRAPAPHSFIDVRRTRIGDPSPKDQAVRS